MKCPNCKSKMVIYEDKYVCPKCNTSVIMPDKKLDKEKSAYLIEQENKKKEKYKEPKQQKVNGWAITALIFAILDPTGILAILFSIFGLISGITKHSGKLMSFSSLLIGVVKLVGCIIGFYYLYQYIQNDPALKEAWDIIMANWSNPTVMFEQFKIIFDTIVQEIKDSIFGPSAVNTLNLILKGK